MGPMCVTLPNFIKIGQTVAEMWRFNNFHNVGRPPSSILEIQFLFVRPLNRPILHNHAKFRGHLSIPCGDMAICVVFKMTTAAILFCEKVEILTACPLSGTNLGHHAKVHQYQSNGCRDMAI